MHDPLGQGEARAVRIPRPVENGAPGGVLGLGQALGIARPVIDEIRARIADKVVHHLGLPRRDPVDGRVDDAGDRHGGGIDLLALRPPFLGQRLGKASGRHGQGLAARGLCRTSVQGEGEDAVPLLDAGLLVEALRQGRLHAGLGGPHGVRLLIGREPVSGICHGPEIIN
jgi:hypothetical protein